MATPPPPAVIDPESFAELNSSDARSLLDTIDSLRELGVGDFVNLPQIIVIGDQSSGKSSVLEAISRVRFPVDGDLCTRFATELVLRRAAETSVNVSIQFADAAPSAAPGDASRQPFHPFQRSTFDKDALPDIIREAKEAMGIRKGGAKRFSKDILRVEVAGPDVYPLTLVDLPGIFHSATADQDLADKVVVDQLIASYMSQPKSIILAVVAANNQLANQAVLREAKTHDPKRERTIGVITKPDMAGRGSANEKKYLDLAKGRESMHKLALGWYVLRNRSEAERSSEAEVRDTVEERFFQSGEWSSISPMNRGVESLRKRLSKVLLDHIKKNLPDLIQDIETNLRTRQQELNRYGKSRSSVEELRSYLLGIADDFQRLARDAVEGRYSDEFFGDGDEHETGVARLRAVLRNMNCAFEAVMDRKGAYYKTKSNEAAADEEAEQDNQHRPELQQLIDVFDVLGLDSKPQSELNAKLQSLASLNRGKEFPGDTNPELVFLLFKKQVAPWQSIARKHIDNVLDVAKAFVERVFVHVVGADEVTRNAILSGCMDPFFAEKKDMLQTKLQELLRPCTSGYALPLDEEFRARMLRKSNQRLGGRLAAALEMQHPELFQSNPGQGLTRQAIMTAVQDVEAKDRFDTDGVIDRMVVYYEMSLRTFIDNVINLAVESCLVYDIPAILTPRKVDAMNPDELKELASESEEVEKQRLHLQGEVKILRQGLQKCQKHKTREVTVLPTALARMSLGPPPAQTPSRAVTPQRSPAPGREPTPSPAAAAVASQQPPVVQNSNPSTQPPFGSLFNGTPLAAPRNGPLFGSQFDSSNKVAAGSNSTGTGTGSFGGFGSTGGFGSSAASSAGSFHTPAFSSPSPLNANRGTSPFGTSKNTQAGISTSTGGGLFGGRSTSTTTPLFGAKQSADPPAASSGLAFGSSTGSNGNKNGNGTPDRPSPAPASRRDELKYAGIEAVPLLDPAERLPCVLTRASPQERFIDQYQHICFQDKLKRFSNEEMRLRWVVEQEV